MESRIFIRKAFDLTNRIKNIAFVTTDEANAERENIQKELNVLFNSLQNPTLPSAAKLVDTAKLAGYNVLPAVIHRITQAENMWEY